MALLKVADKPSREYCKTLQEVIKEAMMGRYNRSKRQLKKIHRVGVASEVMKVITRKMKRGEWSMGYPDDSTVWRRLNELANEGVFVEYVLPKGSGWYRLSEAYLNGEV